MPVLRLSILAMFDCCLMDVDCLVLVEMTAIGSYPTPDIRAGAPYDAENPLSISTGTVSDVIVGGATTAVLKDVACLVMAEGITSADAIGDGGADAEVAVTASGGASGIVSDDDRGDGRGVVGVVPSGVPVSMPICFAAADRSEVS